MIKSINRKIKGRNIHDEGELGKRLQHLMPNVPSFDEVVQKVLVKIVDGMK